MARAENFGVGYSEGSMMLEDICAEADEQLLSRLINDTNHVLHLSLIHI